MEITSLKNNKVKNWVRLHQKKYRDATGQFIIEGNHLVESALKLGLVDELICLEDKYHHPNTFIVTKDILKKLSLQVSSTDVMAICHFNYANEIKGNALIIDDLQDPGNLGTIIRSAVAFDFKTIILSPNTVDILNDKTIRASEGMLFNVNFVKKDLLSTIKELKDLGYVIYGTDVKGGSKITNKDKCAIIIGNEGAGMHDELKSMCDELIHISMSDRCESLNAGVAASILMYEVFHG
jgi:TrmH family RNA methyltransferase